MDRYTLSKNERLSSLKEIESLFKEGQSFSSYPFRLVWRSAGSEGDPPVQVVFSVPKKKFPRAVDRNRIKRLMREVYRMAKPDLYRELAGSKMFYLALIYTGNDLRDFTAIQTGLHKALDRWIKTLRQNL